MLGKSYCHRSNRPPLSSSAFLSWRVDWGLMWDTMMSPCPPSSRPHALAISTRSPGQIYSSQTSLKASETICSYPKKTPPTESHSRKIPLGSGFGGRNSLVTMGAKIFPGKNVSSRCVTGPLQPIPSAHPTQGQLQMTALEIPSTQPHPHSPTL